MKGCLDLHMRIGLIAPPWTPIPPVLYGGIELVVDQLARGLQDAGHEVLLYTDSRPTHAYHGRLGFVSTNAEVTPKSVETPELRTALVYRARVIVTDPDAALRQGMPVTVRLAPGAGRASPAGS